MQNYNPLQNSPISFAELQKNFFETDIVHPDFYSVFRKDLFNYFKNAEPIVKQNLRPYWLLNVYASWKYINNFSPLEVVDYLIDQIPDAIRLGYDVMDKLLWYMEINVRDAETMPSFYAEIKNKVLTGEVYVDVAGKDMKMVDLVQQIRLLNSYQNDAMRTAELYEKIQRILFSSTEKDTIYEYLVTDRRENVEHLIALINFLTTIDPDEIWRAVEGVVFVETSLVQPDEVPVPSLIEPPEQINLTPELEKKAKALMSVDQKKDQLAPDKALSGGEKKDILTKEKVEKNIALNKPTQLNDNKKTSPASPIKPSYVEIRKKIEAVFPKNAEGEYANLDGILAALQSASVKYNDPKIAELMYFDEADNKFKWSV